MYKNKIALLALLLVGCGGRTFVLGEGRMTATDSSVRGIGPAREGAVDRANEHCEEAGKKAVIESFDDRGMDVTLRSTSSVIFHCQ